MEYSNDQLITVSDDEEEVAMETSARGGMIDSSLAGIESSANNMSNLSSRPQSTRLQQISLDDVLNFLRANNLSNAEVALRQEAQHTMKLTEEKSNEAFGDVTTDSKSELSNDRLMSLADVASSSSLPELYRRLVLFVDKTDPAFRPELSTILPAAFTHVYLHLVHQFRRSTVEKIYDPYVSLVPESLLTGATGVQREMKLLRRLRKPEDISLHPVFSSFVSHKYIVGISEKSYEAMKACLLEPGMRDLLRLLVGPPSGESAPTPGIFFDKEGRKVPRTTEEVLHNYGALLGEPRANRFKEKMFIGLPKELTGEEEEGTAGTAATSTEAGEKTGKETEASRRSKKRKMAAAAAAAAKKSDPLGVRKLKLDQNAPEYKRIPLAPIAVSDKLDRIAAQKEYKKTLRISSTALPSICFYTVLNSDSTVSSMAMSNDSLLLACGFINGTIKVWTLQSQRPLRAARSHRELSKIPIEGGDMDVDLESAAGGTTGDLMLMNELMDPQTNSESKQLVGHCGAVFDLDFSPSRHWLLTAGEDGEIRLWSLLLWQCLVVYRGHTMPVTSVRFSVPPALYFVSCGFDQTIRIWSTESAQAVRICIGHNEDVTCVTFHPNCNYIASGSCDRTVRIWDLLDGSCVRCFSNHKDTVQCVQFSPCGQLLASGDQSGFVCLYKLMASSAALCATMSVDPSSPASQLDMAVYSLSFSRDSNSLAVGSGGCFVALYMIERFPSQSSSNSMEGGKQQQQSTALAASLTSNTACPPVRLEPLTVAHTKSTPVHLVHFNRRNLLIAAGPIDR